MKSRRALNQNELCYLSAIRKIICLLLMLWLPIAASSAWAMSTQMQLGSALGMTTESNADMPCHDMGMMAADHTCSSSDTEHDMKHNCSACGACFSVFMVETPVAAFAFATPSSQAAPLADDLLVSQIYPPAL